MEGSVLGSEVTADKGATHRNISSERNQWDPELRDIHLQTDWVPEVPST